MRIVYFIIVACAVLFTTACSTTGGAAGTPGYSGEISKRVPIGAGIDAATTEINRAYGRTNSEPAAGNCNVHFVVRNGTASRIELVEATTFSKTRTAREESRGIVKPGNVFTQLSQLYRTSGTTLIVRDGRRQVSLAVPYRQFCREGGSPNRQYEIGVIVSDDYGRLRMRFGEPYLVRPTY